jgi:hypothetical protein
MGCGRGADVIASLAYELPIICFVVGMLGVVLGACLCVRGYEQRFKAQRNAFELARQKAEHDLQRALSYVPQWMQQAVRVEFELLGRLQTERWKELAQEQQHWQSGQEALRRLEWQALLAEWPGRRSPVPEPAGPVTAGRTAPPAAPAPTLVRSPRPSQTLRHEPEAEPHPEPRREPEHAVVPQPPERELTDEEIDALPPDLPAPAPSRARKLPAPKGPVLRNI